MSDIDKLIEILTKIRGGFYHFTDTRNLALIRASGLLYTRAQKEKERVAIAPGGNDWSLDADRRSGMDAFVHLCFFDDHPMEWIARQQGRIADSLFLKISPQVLRIPDTLIVDTVSNRADAVPRPAEEMIRNLDLKVIYTRTDWKDPAVQERLKAAKKCEILVPSHIPINLITNIPNG
ncbi:DarT ssDNA thymidine ADP-ribosyltransferase family protein [Sphingomonas oligophenolica]|uniref:DarT ssDNA thymidine ADP-ribosyltransferase family protein n=1 Tax=Sphingomonas oligophenolica TaxID=301154 RepID=UPI00138705E1|nr:DarT ssDNA thymidine ADP-ribosyltransferase family protein [Sphingomonas oligophenolica]